MVTKNEMKNKIKTNELNFTITHATSVSLSPLNTLFNINISAINKKKEIIPSVNEILKFIFSFDIEIPY